MRDIRNLNKQGINVAVRADLDTRYVSEDESFENHAKHKSHIETLNYLADRNSKILVLASQNGGGDRMMKKHANILNDLLETRVQYCGTKSAGEVFKNASEGTVSIYTNLDSVDGCLEDYNRGEEKYPKAFVNEISKNSDAYVNDCFSLSHKSYPSIVGIPNEIPGYSGFMLKSEYNVLSGILSMDSKPTFLFSGTDISKKMESIETLLERDKAHKVLTSGLIGSAFLYAEGYDLGVDTRNEVESKSDSEIIEKARYILTKYGDRIESPRDLAVKSHGREEYALSATPLKKPVRDIGEKTIELYNSIISNSSSIIATGPIGVAEQRVFSYGTEKVYSQISKHDKSVIAGSRTVDICNNLGLTGFRHSSMNSKPISEFVAKDSQMPGISSLLPNS